jgi:RNA polymerase sigma factor (sigma-70 family)
MGVAGETSVFLRGRACEAVVTSQGVVVCPRAACVCARRGLVLETCPEVQAGVEPTRLLPRDFASFHDANRVLFLKYLRFRGLSRQDAEDVVNDAFLTLYRARERLWASESPVAFAFKVLRDALADHFRRSVSRPAAGLEEELARETAESPCAPDEIDGLIARLDLERAISKLPPRQADCMRLYALLDQDVRTIALCLGITPSAVASHLHIARQRLAEIFGPGDRRMREAGSG